MSPAVWLESWVLTFFGSSVVFGYGAVLLPLVFLHYYWYSCGNKNLNYSGRTVGKSQIRSGQTRWWRWKESLSARTSSHNYKIISTTRLWRQRIRRPRWWWIKNIVRYWGKKRRPDDWAMKRQNRSLVGSKLVFFFGFIFSVFYL